MSVISIFIALGSAVVAVYALDQAREARSRAAATAAAPAPVAPAPGATTPAAATPTTPAPTTAAFVPEQLRAQLVLPATRGCEAGYVDVDNLQIGVAAGHEFYLTTCVGPQTLRIDRVDAAVVTATGATAEACLSQLAGITTPPQDLSVLVTPGATICLLTSKADAVAAAQPQRLGIIEVTEVRADRSLALAVTTYRMPASPA